MITMGVFVLVIAASSQIFTGLLTQFKQQSKIAETNVGGIVGLDLLRRDIAHGGYGLPWNITGLSDTDGDGNLWEQLTNYGEAASVSTVSPDPAIFNDATRDADGDGNDGEAPRAFVLGNNADFSNDFFDGSDYLVIKSLKVANNFAAGKWQHIRTGNIKTWWVPHMENICRADDNSHQPNIRVIVISPGRNDLTYRSLVVSSGAYFTYADYPASGFAPPVGDPEVRVMYGVDPVTNLRMPFNRADYYLGRPANMPLRCAPDTGILYKATINHSNGQRTDLPLVDCVADMQIVFGLDMNENGTVGTFTDLTTVSNSALESEGSTVAGVQATFADASLIRSRLKEVRAYILAHEGQQEGTYAFDNFTGSATCPTCVRVGESASLGRDFDLSAIAGFLNYRWKVYRLSVEVNNLGG
jgi:hypothetical protein